MSITITRPEDFRIWRPKARIELCPAPRRSPHCLTGRRPAEERPLFHTWACETEAHKIWIEHCEAAEGIEDEFEALEFLLGEFWTYLEAAEADSRFRDEVPAFAAEIKSMFNAWRLTNFLDGAGPAAPIDTISFDDDESDPEEVEEIVREDEIQVARDLRLVERAREWLLEESDR
ncbi:MAG: hypothetical protein RIC55_04520 [Pirellulaceae bacterium]